MKEKRTNLYRVSILCLLLLTSCKDVNKASEPENRESKEIVYEPIAANDIRHVNISGNARSIIIKQGTDTAFHFQNADLNTAHTYEVHSTKKDDTLDIIITMEHGEADHDVLGSFLLYLPQKEFDSIETAGDFKQTHINTIQSDIIVHANSSVVVLNVTAAQLKHDILLDGTEAAAFSSISVYLDTLPTNICMEISPTQKGSLHDPQHILTDGRLISGTKKPVIRINGAKEVNLYKKDS